jgi:hypothetical protein
MLKYHAVVLVLTLLVLPTAGVYAESITVSVDGASGPWDTTINPSYPYGIPVNGTPNVNLGPTVVSTTSGLAMTPGDALTISWLSGNVCGGASGTAWTNGANGDAAWGIYYSPNDASSTPAYYAPSDQFPIVFMQLIGVFGDSAGVIVGNPFRLGNDPVTVSIPSGSSQLQLGFVDGWYNDNFATLQVSVTEAVPEPSALVLLGIALISLLAYRGRRTA